MSVETITDLAMEVFPEALVKDTKDVEELIQAGGALLKAALKVISAYGEDEGYTPRRVRAEMKLLEEAGLL